LKHSIVPVVYLISGSINSSKKANNSSCLELKHLQLQKQMFGGNEEDEKQFSIRN